MNNSTRGDWCATPPTRRCRGTRDGKRWRGEIISRRGWRSVEERGIVMRKPPRAQVSSMQWTRRKKKTMRNENDHHVCYFVFFQFKRKTMSVHYVRPQNELMSSRVLHGFLDAVLLMIINAMPMPFHYCIRSPARKRRTNLAIMSDAPYYWWCLRHWMIRVFFFMATLHFTDHTFQCLIWASTHHHMPFLPFIHYIVHSSVCLHTQNYCLFRCHYYLYYSLFMSLTLLLFILSLFIHYS